MGFAGYSRSLRQTHHAHVVFRRTRTSFPRSAQTPQSPRRPRPPASAPKDHATAARAPKDHATAPQNIPPAIRDRAQRDAAPPFGAGAPKDHETAPQKTTRPRPKRPRDRAPK